jgi:hypothetical protein
MSVSTLFRDSAGHTGEGERLPLFYVAILSCLIAILPLQVFAEESQAEQELDIKLTSDQPYLHVIHEGQSVRIQRVQDPEYVLKQTNGISAMPKSLYSGVMVLNAGNPPGPSKGY